MKKILVTDDEKVMRSMLTDFLEEAGYEVSQAEDGQIAWSLWQEGKYDLVISDINMPNMNGIELLKNIKKTDENFPVIIITGVSVESAHNSANENNADALLIKPFKMKALVDEIKKVMD